MSVGHRRKEEGLISWSTTWEKVLVVWAEGEDLTEWEEGGIGEDS